MADSTPLTLTELAERLERLGLRVMGDGGARVSSLSEDSRRVEPGGLFVARRGARVDGTQLVAAARERGAVAVLAEAGSGVEFEPRLEATDIAAAWGAVAQELAGRPSEKLRVVGITGTNGKTTTSGLVARALEDLGVPVARLGTLGFFLGTERLCETLTTPQPDELARIMALAVERGAQVLVMEVSSHALDQGRVAGVRFDVAAFTNLTRDHLDYHGDLERYGAAKAKLFFAAAPRVSVVHTGDEFGRGLAARLEGAVRVEVEPEEQVEIAALAPETHARGIGARIVVDGREHEFSSRLLGRHNLENVLVALGVLRALEIPTAAALEALGRADNVPGRLERVDEPTDDLVVVVDYAHTPDALERVLATLREATTGPLVCVFGCGGDRDRTKRAPMGHAAARWADVIWLTSDNPRTEDPAHILDDVRPGLAGARGVVLEELDRARAIERALLEAEPGSTVLVAGKGHEDYQLVGDRVLAFDDRIEARRALESRRQGRAS